MMSQLEWYFFLVVLCCTCLKTCDGSSSNPRSEPSKKELSVDVAQEHCHFDKDRFEVLNQYFDLTLEAKQPRCLYVVSNLATLMVKYIANLR